MSVPKGEFPNPVSRPISRDVDFKPYTLDNNFHNYNVPGSYYLPPRDPRNAFARYSPRGGALQSEFQSKAKNKSRFRFWRDSIVRYGGPVQNGAAGEAATDLIAGAYTYVLEPLYNAAGHIVSYVQRAVPSTGARKVGKAPQKMYPIKKKSLRINARRNRVKKSSRSNRAKKQKEIQQKGSSPRNRPTYRRRA